MATHLHTTSSILNCCYTVWELCCNTMVLIVCYECFNFIMISIITSVFFQIIKITVCVVCLEDYNNFIFSVSVVYIKEEPEDAAFVVKIEPDINSMLVKQEDLNEPMTIEKNKIIGCNASNQELVMEENPLQLEFVSKYLINVLKCLLL